MSRSRGLAPLVVLYLLIAHLIPIPDTITPQGWRQTAIFICVIAGMVTEPLPASALVLMGLFAVAGHGPPPGAALVLMGLAAMAANGTPMREILGGFSEPSVWLVIAAMLIAKMMLDCG